MKTTIKLINNYKYILCFLFLGSSAVDAQQVYTLDNVREKIIADAYSSFTAQAKKQKAALDYDFYKATLKPQVSLNATLPNFIQSFRETVQPDGTINFQSIQQNNSSLSLGATQAVPQTGGQFFLMTDLQRFDDFNSKSTLYNGIPFRIGFNQPIFGYNPFKFQKKIQPLRLEESVKTYTVEIESALLDASQLFFEVIIADANKKTAQLNNEINLELSRITDERFALGKVSKEEKLQLEIEIQNAQLNYAQASISYTQAHLDLQSSLGLTSTLDSFSYTAPLPMSNIPVDINKAVEEALKNRPEMVSYRRKNIEAQDNLAQLKNEYGIQTNLSASYGLARSSENLDEIYTQPLDEKQVRLSVAMPILDWGKKKSVLKMARIELEDINRQNEQGEIVLKNNVKSIALRFIQLQNELKLQKSILDLTVERFDISNQRYILGNINITDLTLAQRDNNQAQQNYINTLKNYWLTYYQLRLVTSYDFITNTTIQY